MSGPKYRIHFLIEWGGGCLWPGNEAAGKDFGLGPYDLLEPCPLPLSEEVCRYCKELAAWHDAALNWDYPPDPGPWRQQECDRFNAAGSELLTAIRKELGAAFEVIEAEWKVTEDRDLDAYQADPRAFRRKQE
jgi:hypothetical protein